MPPALGRAYHPLQPCYGHQISRVRYFVSAEVMLPSMGSAASARGAPI